MYEWDWLYTFFLGLLFMWVFSLFTNVSGEAMDYIFMIYGTIGAFSWLIKYLLSIVYMGMYDEE